MNKLTSMANTCLLVLLLGLTIIAATGCDSPQKKVDPLKVADVGNDSVESLRDDGIIERKNKKKAEIIEEKIGPGWEELGRVSANWAVQSNGKLIILGFNGLDLYLYAKCLGNDIVYQATTKKIEEWGEAENDLELVIKGNYSAYYQGEEYHFNATALHGWYFNLP